MMTVVLVAGAFLAACQSAPVPKDVPNTSGMASVNDIRMYYEIHGDGVPLISAWRTTAPPAGNQIPVLSRDYQVTLGCRGHGRPASAEQRISYAP
jgi:hypothetical protein